MVQLAPKWEWIVTEKGEREYLLSFISLFMVKMKTPCACMSGASLPSFVRRCEAWAAILYSGSPTLLTSNANKTW